MTENYRAGFIGLLGEPNSGKSTLFNLLVGEKISAVSEKPQTTRQRIQGVVSTKTMQAIFVDSPGVIHSSAGLNSFLEAEYKDVMKSVDGILAVISAESLKGEGPEGTHLYGKKAAKMIDELGSFKKPWRMIVTKSDLLNEKEQKAMEQQVRELSPQVIFISALRHSKSARRYSLELIRELLPEADGPLYDSDLFTTHSLRQLASEIVREKCFLYLQKEIPYSVAVRVRSFEEKETIHRVHAEIVVSKESHKGILVGKAGSQIKKIGQASREEMEKLFDQRVFLDLHVVLEKDWMRDPKRMKELGYVLPT